MTPASGDPPDSLNTSLIVRLAATDALVWSDWDHGCVVFSRATGETHFLDLWTSYLLRLIEDGPRTQEVLATVMAEDLSQVRDAAFDQKLTNTLDNFESMALVERCPAD